MPRRLMFWRHSRWRRRYWIGPGALVFILCIVAILCRVPILAFFRGIFR